MMDRVHQKFIYHIWALYQECCKRGQIDYRQYVSFDKTYSARNLDAYLMHKSNTDKAFDDELRSCGLALSSPQHMLRSYHQLLLNLGFPWQSLPSPTPLHLSSRGLLTQRADDLFGARSGANSPPLMLTLDVNMSDSPLLEQLLDGGMTIARINCAYGDEAAWSRLISSIRAAEARLRSQGRYGERHCRIYMDIAGPKLRIQELIPAPGHKSIKLAHKDKLRVLLGDAVPVPVSDAKIPAIQVNMPQAFDHIAKGHQVFIDDGKIYGVVTDHNTAYIDIEIFAPAIPVSLKNHKGINLPDTSFGASMTFLTTKDERDLAFVCRHADIAGISFVQYPQDLQKVRAVLQQMNAPEVAVIAKIETKEAVRQLSELLFEGLHFPRFGIMVARGDLALEIGFEQLSIVQEDILTLSHAAHIPVILATQILDTLAKKGTPSRAELTDLSFGSEFDCLMLNKGPFLVQAVTFIQDTMSLISHSKEYHLSIVRP